MRIVIINRHRAETLGGSEIQCDLLARGLSGRGHNVTYIAADGNGPYNDCPYRVLPVPLDANAIAKACLGERPDVVYWRLNKNGLKHVACRVQRSGIPFVFASAHINDLRPWAIKPRRQRGPLGAIARLRLRLVARWNHEGFRWVAAVITNNPDHLGLAPVERQVFIANSMTSMARPFSWPRPYILWVANLKPAKRPDRCIELARRLDGTGVDVLMVGAAYDYRPIEEPERLPANLHYLGQQPLETVNGMLAGARCLVKTCMPEGFSNNFIQASLQAIPTISLDFDPGGAIRNNVLGLYSGGDFDRFVIDVRTVLADETLAHALGQRARAYAEEHFDPERNVVEVETFLLAVATRVSREIQANGPIPGTPRCEAR